MVVKTDVCAFSETRVYPGHGIRLIRKDGQLIVLFSAKCRTLLKQRKKPAKLAWTAAWRRLHKKKSDHDTTKKRAQKPEFRNMQREAALREVKERNKAKKT